MNQGFDKGVFWAGDAEDVHSRRTANDSIVFDPALFEGQHDIASSSQLFMNRQGRRSGQPIYRPHSYERTSSFPGSLPGSQEDMQRPRMMSNALRVHRPSQQVLHSSSSNYPDAGLVDRGSLWNRGPQPNFVAEAGAGTSFHKAQSEAYAPGPKEIDQDVAQPSKKRARAEACFVSADIEDNAEDSANEARRSTRQSKRIKVSRKHNDTGEKSERKKRKVSKLETRVAEGKCPQKGSLGPKGEVRYREDGRMVFRDVNNPQWTLAAYHNDYRQELLDEAARAGQFDHAPACGEAALDRTSFEPCQQSWGSSRADWQRIVNSEGVRVMFEFGTPKSRRPPQEPKDLIREGLVLLDSKNHPVKDWPGLNKTLSTEIESWRWEALMRMYPWLSVADLLARMPHERVKRGKVLPLQTPQAFTNRSHRLRVPNQIPTTNPKNGSATYKEEIYRNLVANGASSTEGLSILNSSQIDKARRKNKGKFLGNSRYVSTSDDSPKIPPASKRRKIPGDYDVEPECERNSKRLCTQIPQNVQAQSDYNDNVVAYGEVTNVYDACASPAGQWTGLGHGNHAVDGTDLLDDQSQEYLVPLFACIEDQGLAVIEDASWTSPAAVILARRNGNQQTRQIGVYWYRPSVPRHVGADGIIVDDVVDLASSHLYQAEEMIPGDMQLGWQNDSADAVAPPSSHCSIPTAIGSLFDEPSCDSSQSFPPQGSYSLESTASSSSQTPLSALDQSGWYTGRYQTQSDSVDEVWRNDYGPAGF